MLPRLLSSAVGLPILLGAIWFGDFWFFGLAIVVTSAALLEFYRFFMPDSGMPLAFVGTVFGLLFIIDAYQGGTQTIPLLVITIIITLLMLLPTRHRFRLVSNWARLVAGILYIGLLLSYFVSLRGLSFGREWVLLVVLSTFAVDTGAFFVGKAIGRHRMAPRISPGKTWEGAVGGVAGGLIAAGALVPILGLSLVPTQTVFLGGLIAVFAQLGDLTESLLKRSAGVKDASRLIPGHGGILDRLDSLLFTGVVVYYYVLWVIK